MSEYKPSTEEVAWYGTKQRAIEAHKEEERRIEDLAYQDYLEKKYGKEPPMTKEELKKWH